MGKFHDGKKGGAGLDWAPSGIQSQPYPGGYLLAKESEQWGSANYKVWWSHAQREEGIGVTLLQQVGDLLIGAAAEKTCIEATTSLVNCSGLAGHRVSKKVAQVANGEVGYLGFKVSKHLQKREKRLHAGWQCQKLRHN